MGFLGIIIKLPTSCQCLFATRIWRTDAEGQFAGEEVSEWFSRFLKRPGCKFYQVTKPRFISEDSIWSDVGKPGDKVRYLCV